MKNLLLAAMIALTGASAVAMQAQAASLVITTDQDGPSQDGVVLRRHDRDREFRRDDFRREDDRRDYRREDDRRDFSNDDDRRDDFRRDFRRHGDRDFRRHDEYSRRDDFRRREMRRSHCRVETQISWRHHRRVIERVRVCG